MVMEMVTKMVACASASVEQQVLLKTHSFDVTVAWNN